MAGAQHLTLTLDAPTATISPSRTAALNLLPDPLAPVRKVDAASIVVPLRRRG